MVKILKDQLKAPEIAAVYSTSNSAADPCQVPVRSLFD
jgi:hypothetical protein